MPLCRRFLLLALIACLPIGPWSGPRFEPGTLLLLFPTSANNSDPERRAVYCSGERSEQAAVGKTESVSIDVFAGIAERDMAARRDRLIEVPPPILPRKMFPKGKSDPSAAFTPTRKLDSPEDLDAELRRQRQRYAPFLEDHAPGFPPLRYLLRLVDFQWRLETEADRADFLHTMSGAGEWTSVKVPHFGGPIGRAVAYYRNTFPVSLGMLDRGALFVRFGAVDYKAHVFVNGHYLGSHEGFFAPFEFDCTASVHEGDNILLVKVENDAIYMGNDSWGQGGRKETRRTLPPTLGGMTRRWDGIIARPDSASTRKCSLRPVRPCTWPISGCARWLKGRGRSVDRGKESGSADPSRLF